MNKRRFFILIMGLALSVAAFPWVRDVAEAGPGTAATAAAATPSGGTFYANSPILTKFVDSLAGLGAANANNLGQYITVAVPDTTTFSGSDYYEIALVEYREQMHSDLPQVVGGKTSGTGGTKLRGYVQEINGVPVTEPHYLGPMIIATKDRPVRIKFRNALPTGASGNLFLPVDATVSGAGMGALDTLGASCDRSLTGATCAQYTQNRALLHLYGGFNPWISNGTPHQWITPAGETTQYAKGASQKNVPDMWFDATTHAVIPGASLTAPNLNATNDPGPGSSTYYFTNAQTARLLFYQDNSLGITRLNVYAGEMAGYQINDPIEQGLITSGIIPSTQIPLIIEDKTFVPQDITVQDAKWDTTNWGTYGNLWIPHVYETNQWPTNPSLSGLNDFGRWDYGPWFWPIFPVDASKAGIYTSATSIVPESLMDTPVINGTAYPYLNVDPKAYRFRILNASSDRYLNLGLYYADPIAGQGKEVKMVPANLPIPADLAADLGQGTELYSGSWTTIDSKAVTAMAFSSGNSILYVNMGTKGLWQFDGTSWSQISTLQPTMMAASPTLLYVQFAGSGIWLWDGVNLTRISSASASKMVTSGSTLYADFSPYGLWQWGSNGWALISWATVTNMVTTDSLLYVDLSPWGLWRWNGASWTMINSSSPGIMVTSGTNLYAEYGVQGLWQWNGSAWTKLSPASVSNMVASTSALYADLSPWGLWQWNGASWGMISNASPSGMVASGTNLYANYGVWGLWKWDPSVGFTQISTTQPDVMAAVSFSYPVNWPTDGRDGGVPAPTTVGPKMIQIGNDGGLLPEVVEITNQPINYIYFRRIITVTNIASHALLLAPGERADVIVDFSQAPAGSKLIMYNDAPAPFPQTGDPRYDYYTGDPDQTSTGGAPTTKPGFGPNTRTIMQFRVSNATAAAAFDVEALKTSLPAAYAGSQKRPIVGESAYNSAFGTTFTDTYADIHTGSSTVPTFSFTAGASFSYIPSGSTTLTAATAGQTVQLPVYDKAIVEEMDPYGREYFQLGTELTYTNFTTQTTLPFNYLDPASETLLPSEVQIWKITHNGVMTHPLHIDSMEMQLINRVAWDGTLAPPDPGELGWKDTVMVNPLETAFIAVRANTPPTPATMGTLTRSNRLLDPTMPANTTVQFMNIDPLTGQAPTTAVSNILTDFGWEYAWSTRQWGHQDNDMKRPVILDVQ